MSNESPKIKGIAFILCSAFCFACMASMVKLAGDLPVFEKAFFRNAVAAVIALAIMLKNKIKFEIPAASRTVVLARVIVGTLGLFMNFYGLSKLNLADATILNKLSPFFAIVFSVFVLNEKIRPVQLFTVIGALIGAVFVIKPTGSGMDSLPGLIALLSGMFAGLAYTCLRKASRGGVKGIVIVLCFSVFSSVSAIPFIAVNFVLPTLRQFIILLLCGCFGAAGQFLITAAYSYAPAREISVFSYSQIIFAAILSYLLFHQLPDRWSLLGYILIIGMAVLNFIYNQKASAGRS